MLEIFDVEQNSDEWLAARLGIPTSSMFAAVMAKGEGKTRAKYMRQLAGERLTGKSAETYSNANMERGHVHEDHIRQLYAFENNVEPIRIGFARNGEMGASPDSLIGKSGIFEAKSKFPDLVIECIARDNFPPEHKAQTQGQLLVLEREWVDIGVGWMPEPLPIGIPLFVKRATRDEPYLANLHGEINRFNDELLALVEKIRSYGIAA